MLPLLRLHPAHSLVPIRPAHQVNVLPSATSSPTATNPPHTPHAVHAQRRPLHIPRTRQVQTRQVHQLAQCTSQCCCCPCLCTCIVPIHPAQPLNISRTPTTTNAPHPTRRTHTTKSTPHTYPPSSDSSGSPACPVRQPMLLLPVYPAQSLVVSPMQRSRSIVVAPQAHQHTADGITKTRPYSPRTFQAQTRQVNQLAQCTSQCCRCSPSTQPSPWCPHPCSATAHH